MTTTPIAAVTGASGAQGAAIAAAFRDAGWQVRGLTRGGTAAPPGIQPLAVPPGDAAALDRALEGASVLAVTLPLDHRRSVREAWLAGLLLAELIARRMHMLLGRA
jgi:nucleoside-diphosphate-sugar epimerase